MTTGKPATASRRGVFDVDEHRATEAFRLVRGQAYDIAFTAGTWRACRLASIPGQIIELRFPAAW